MLKRSSSRNRRSRVSKLKHAIQLFMVLAICFWMLYHVKQSCGSQVASKEKSIQIFAQGLNGEEILRLGRKGLNPRANELDAEYEKLQNEELKLEDEERKVRDHNQDESSAEDEEIDDKTEEEEQEQLEDLIDEDDKED